MAYEIKEKQIIKIAELIKFLKSFDITLKYEIKISISDYEIYLVLTYTETTKKYIVSIDNEEFQLSWNGKIKNFEFKSDLIEFIIKNNKQVLTDNEKNDFIELSFDYFKNNGIDAYKVSDRLSDILGKLGFYDKGEKK